MRAFPINVNETLWAIAKGGWESLLANGTVDGSRGASF